MRTIPQSGCKAELYAIQGLCRGLCSGCNRFRGGPHQWPCTLPLPTEVQVSTFEFRGQVAEIEGFCLTTSLLSLIFKQLRKNMARYQAAVVLAALCSSCILLSKASGWAPCAGCLPGCWCTCRQSADLTTYYCCVLQLTQPLQLGRSFFHHLNCPLLHVCSP